MSGEASREMTLREYMGRLPERHTARQEFEKLDVVELRASRLAATIACHGEGLAERDAVIDLQREQRRVAYAVIEDAAAALPDGALEGDEPVGYLLVDGVKQLALDQANLESALARLMRERDWTFCKDEMPPPSTWVLAVRRGSSVPLVTCRMVSIDLEGAGISVVRERPDDPVHDVSRPATRDRPISGKRGAAGVAPGRSVGARSDSTDEPARGLRGHGERRAEHVHRRQMLVCGWHLRPLPG